ncbi:MAG: transposase, partial [Ktedonobacterales bacterium]
MHLVEQQVICRTDPRFAAVDLGVDTLAALTSNKVGFAPRLVNGRVLKSYNQFYNKRGAELQTALGHNGTTARMERMSTKRTRRINHYLHTASKAIIDLLIARAASARWSQAKTGCGSRQWNWGASTISTLSRYHT